MVPDFAAQFAARASRDAVRRLAAEGFRVDEGLLQDNAQFDQALALLPKCKSLRATLSCALAEQHGALHADLRGAVTRAQCQALHTGLLRGNVCAELDGHHVLAVCLHRGWTFWNGWDHFFGTPASERVKTPINAVRHFVAVLFAENGAAVVAPGGAMVAPHLAPLAPRKANAVAGGLTAAVVGQKLAFGPQK
eukprot:gene13006-8683_t